MRCGPVVGFSALHSVVAGSISSGGDYTQYTLLWRINKVEKAVQCFHMSHAMHAGFSGYDNSIYNIY